MGAISFKDTPTAPKDSSWDGPAEVAAASIDDLKAMCAWVDSDNPDVKSSYKLPHHKADGDHAVVWRGVANAMARLSQTQIPDADRKAVYNHLAKHYSQFDETPPEYKEYEPPEIKHLEAVIEKASGGVLTAVASTNTTDRHGEIVDNNGWDLKAFKKNPVILWGHDHNEPAIGISKKTWVEGEGKKARLMIQPVLHDLTDKAKAVKALVDNGIIKTLSVGFRPLESPDGTTFTKNELLEVSMVNVPANADAMMMAYKSLKDKGFDDEVIEEIGIKQMDEAQMRASMKAMQTAMKTMQSHMDNMAANMGMKDYTPVIDSDVDLYEDDDDATVKVPEATDPQDIKIIRERLSMNKVIARAADKILEADKKNVPVDQKHLVKVIKRANEILTIAEKDKLNG